MKTKKRKKRIGSSAFARALVPVLLAVSTFGPAGAAVQNEKNKSFVVVAGTVFRDSGLSLPDARVTVVADPEPGSKAKVKKVEARSDARGEFAVRVPPVPMRYNVTISATGFETWQKQVSVQGYERVDLSILLERSK